MMPTRRTLSLGLLALAALPAACASPNPDLLTLDAVPGPAFGRGPRRILLQDVVVAHYLDRKALVRSSDDYHIAVETNDWWGEPFSAMIGRVLASELDQRLTGSTVFTEGGAVDVRPDATVAVNITRFDRSGLGQVLLTGQWGITPRGAQRPSVTDGGSFTAPVAGKDVTAQVAAMSAALGQLADRLAQALAV